MRYCRLLINRALTLRACAGKSYVRADFMENTYSSYVKRMTLLLQIEFLTRPLHPNVSLKEIYWLLLKNV